MRKLLACCFVFAAANCFAADKVLSEEGESIKSNIKVVFGEGFGETSEEALKEAMRDVMQTAVGVYVRSDFRMLNKKVIEDQVLTHSAAFIDHYNKVDEGESEDGRGKFVSIKAWVKIRNFADAMRGLAPSSKIAIDGALLNANVMNNVNAEELLKKEMKDMNPFLDWVDIALVDSIPVKVCNSDEDSVTLRYVYQLTYSPEKYTKGFSARMTALLDQIAEQKIPPKTAALEMVKDEIYPCSGIRYLIKDCSVPSKAAKAKLHQWDDEKKTVSLIPSISRAGSAEVRKWVLSSRLYEVFYVQYKKQMKKARAAKVSLSLLDSNGETLAGSLGEMPMEPSGNVGLLCSDVIDPHRILYDFIPLFNSWNIGASKFDHDWDWHDKFVGCIDVKILKEDVPSVKSAEIKIEMHE